MEVAVQDAISDCDYYIFLINVCDRIAAAFMSSKWMSRYCNAHPWLGTFFPPASQNLVQRQRTAEGGGKNGPKPKKQPKTQ